METVLPRIDLYMFLDRSMPADTTLAQRQVTISLCPKARCLAPNKRTFLLLLIDSRQTGEHAKTAPCHWISSLYFNTVLLGKSNSFSAGLLSPSIASLSRSNRKNHSRCVQSFQTVLSLLSRADFQRSATIHTTTRPPTLTTDWTQLRSRRRRSSELLIEGRERAEGLRSEDSCGLMEEQPREGRVTWTPCEWSKRERDGEGGKVEQR